MCGFKTCGIVEKSNFTIPLPTLVCNGQTILLQLHTYQGLQEQMNSICFLSKFTFFYRSPVTLYTIKFKEDYFVTLLV